VKVLESLCDLVVFTIGKPLFAEEQVSSLSGWAEYAQPGLNLLTTKRNRQ
jgi:hypothetical protein